MKNFLGLADEILGERRERGPYVVLHHEARHTEKTGNNVYDVSTFGMQHLKGTEMEAYRYASKL